MKMTAISLCWTSAILVFFHSPMFAQGNYSSGFYIDENQEKISGLILHDDWELTPQVFSFKKTENSNIQVLNVDKVKVVEVMGQRYERHEVSIDRSSEEVEQMSLTRNPEFAKEILFLQLLIDGDPSLYKYDGQGVQRFFYKKRENDTPEQLVFKSYRFNKGNSAGPADGRSSIGYNRQYRQQLLNNYLQDGLNRLMVESVRYQTSDLVNIFLRINGFRSYDAIQYKLGRKQSKWNATFKLGYYSLMSILNLTSSFEEELEGNFPNSGEAIFGIEIEYALNKDRTLMAYLDGSSYIYQGTAQLEGGTLTTGSVEFENKGFLMSLGLKYYIPIAASSEIFAKVGYLKPLERTLDLTYLGTVRIPESHPGGVTIGSGINVHNWIFELKYNFERTIPYSFRIDGTIQVSSISISTGYRF